MRMTDLVAMALNPSAIEEKIALPATFNLLTYDILPIKITFAIMIKSLTPFIEFPERIAIAEAVRKENEG